MITFLLKVVVISLSGVMAPGPMTAATLAAGARRRHAGLGLAVGHGIVEFPLMILLVAGASVWLKMPAFQLAIGLVGGVVLLVLGGQMLARVRHPPTVAATAHPAGPVWTGIVLTGGNPYFLLWWATVGLTLATQASSLGVWAFVVFAITHWLCDLLWLEVLSNASFKGVKVLGPRTLPAIQGVCGAAMAVFGGWFLWDAVRGLSG